LWYRFGVKPARYATGVLVLGLVLGAVGGVRGQTSRATINPSAAGVVHNPSERGVVHSPYKQGVVLNLPRGGRDVADTPAVVNFIPARPAERWYHNHHYYGGYWPYQSYGSSEVYSESVGGESAAGALGAETPVASPPRSTPYILGEHWGQDLRREVVTWDQFVAYVHDRVATADAVEREEFRRGFVAGYGINAASAFAKALASPAPAAAAATNAEPAAPAARPRPDTLVTPYGTVTVK
jgi:hypothetical protein